MKYGELPAIEMDGSDGSKKTIEGYLVQVINPPKMAILRLPTSEEALERLARAATVIPDGRSGQSEAVETRSDDKKLFDALRLDKPASDKVVSISESWDEYEASNAVARVCHARVIGIERLGSQFEVSLETYAGVSVHTIESPYDRDMARLRQTLVVTRRVGRNKTEYRYRNDVAVEVYNKFVRKATNYAGLGKDMVNGILTHPAAAVPDHHKFHVMLEISEELAALDPVLSPNS